MTTPVQAGQSITANLLNSIAARVTAGAATGFSNSNAETVVGTVTIPATDPLLNVQFSGFEMRCVGVCSTTGTPTVTVRVRLGSVAGTLVYNPGALATTNAANLPFFLIQRFFITTAGASGFADFFGEMQQQISGSATVVVNGTTGVAVNTTAPVTLVVTAQFSAAAAGNTFNGDAITMNRF